MEEDFAPLITSSWKAPLASGPTNHLDSFSLKLGRLKGIVKGWERKKKCERKQLILDINDEISNILLMDSGLLTAAYVDKLKGLQDRKGKFWAHEVTTTRLKSQELWINEGDANTKFFHSYASARRNSKAI